MRLLFFTLFVYFYRIGLVFFALASTIYYVTYVLSKLTTEMQKSSAVRQTQHSLEGLKMFSEYHLKERPLMTSDIRVGR